MSTSIAATDFAFHLYCCSLFQILPRRTLLLEKVHGSVYLHRAQIHESSWLCILRWAQKASFLALVLIRFAGTASHGR